MKTSIEKTFSVAALCALAVGASASTACAIAEVGLSGGVLSYAAIGTVANQVKIAFGNAAYTIDDPAESQVTLSADAITAGCAAFDNNTLTCPAATVTSLRVSTSDNIDVIDVSKSAVPAVLDGGFSSDTVIGTPFDDTIAWNPGGGSDTIDGGGGFDELLFTGSNANEVITVKPIGEGFEVTRDIATVDVVALHVEDLALSTLGGTDTVRTQPLLVTAQSIVDGDDGVTTDRLEIAGNGLCVTRQGDTFTIEARAPISIARFTDVLVSSSFCLADPCTTAAATGGCIVNGVKNQLCQGGDGNDVIVGTKGSDVIKAGAGNDRVRALDGDDIVCGEEGDDKVSGGAGNDRLFGGPGNDALKGDAGNDLVAGQSDADALSGGGGNDEVDGGSGNDRVLGLGGNDVLRGGADVDRIDGGPGLDFCTDIEIAPPFPHCEAP
jgi:Ca2+-binding RTX toxin-like protein